MKNQYTLTLTILLFLVGFASAVTAWSQDDQKAPKADKKETEPSAKEELTPQDPQALMLLQEARSRLFQHKFMQANLTQRVSLGDFRFEASGKYYASMPLKTRLEYSVKLGEMKGTFLEVCDGQVLHTSRQIQSSEIGKQDETQPQLELTRRDIQKILRETRLHIDEPEAVRAAEIGIGGIPAILASLERSMVFYSMKEAEHDGKPTLVLQGRWNPEVKGKLLTGLGGIASQIQQFLPDRVQVIFDKETLFPNKFQYLKKISNEGTTYRPLLTVEFTDIVLNEPIPIQRFTYIPPPGMEERDETETFLKGIQDAAGLEQPDAKAESEEKNQ